MTRISRKLISWLLGALACVAIIFGIVIARPQTKTAAAADTAVTFSAAVLDKHIGSGDTAAYAPCGYSIRFDTSGAQWSTYHSWVAANAWGSIADYTTINGRTVTEINNATTHSQKITLMMQPAGSFSFLRLYIPAEIMDISDVKSMGILDGWSFNNGTNNYTASAVTFLRNGDTMLEASAYTATTKYTASNITIGTASNINPTNTNIVLDSYMVNIDIGQDFSANGGYNTMYDTYKTIRKSIYINGKSIEEWNSQKIAEDSRFKDPSTYTTFPQNSRAPDHADVFIKPVALWGTSTGFKLSIFQELVADCEEVVVKVGAGCMMPGSFIVSESKSATVLSQTVVDLTSSIALSDHDNQYEGTEQYTLYMGGNYWSSAPAKNWGTSTLNEFDAQDNDGVGGQIQMKYIYLNDKSLYDINVESNEAFGSSHGNIVNGGQYAPIMAFMGLDTNNSNSYLMLQVPSAYPSGSGTAENNHQSITIKKGFNVAKDGFSYYVTNDIVFTNNNDDWSKEVKGNELATEVTGIITKANRTDNGTNENFVIFQLSNNDYAGCNTTAIKDISSLFNYIDIGGNFVTAPPGEPFFNVWNLPNSIAFRAPGLNAAALQNVPYITIKAGAKFPSYNSQYNGAPLTYYVTSEDITFIHDVPNDTWTVGAQPTVEYTVTFTVDGSTYATESVERGNAVSEPAAPTKAEDANYTYTFDGWYLNGNKYDFSTEVTSDITLEAKFTATPKANTVDLSTALTIVDQGNLAEGTETYLVKTSSLCWIGVGCLNDATVGDELLKNIYFNGVSIYDINAADDGTYGSEHADLKKGSVYAPIAVYLYNDQGKYSYIQIHVPTDYPNVGASAEDNHKRITIGEGFSYTEGNTTWNLSKDVTWVNFNNNWVNKDATFAADTVTIGNPRIDGTAKELYKVDITSDSWTIDCNHFDFMYGNAYDTYRQYIYINGVSVYDINANTDDSGYTYSTSPMNSTADGHPELFAHPVLIYTEAEGEVNSNTLTLWIHKNYIESLGDDITITLGAGYNAFTNERVLEEDVHYSMIANVTVDNGTQISTTKIIKGNTANDILGTPTKGMTATTVYTFENWYVANTDTLFDPTTPITEDISIEARFTETAVNLIETEVVGIIHYLKTSDDNWLAFELTENDYVNAAENYNMEGAYAELIRIGFLDNVVLKGTICMNNGTTVSEATLMDVYNSYGPQEGPLLNFWGVSKFALRLPVGDGVEEIVIKEGCFFPSYAYVSGNTSVDTRYVMYREATYKYNESVGAFVKQAGISIDIQMENGASVRVTSDMTTSGIRFQTNISKTDLEALQAALQEGKYDSVTLGTLIVPTDYLMGGSFTHAWLDNNGWSFIDLESSVDINDLNSFPKNNGTYYSYFGSIVKLKETNYSRAFSGIGYVKLEKDGVVTYAYAAYESRNSRSASFVANAAINDRNATQTDEYKHSTNNNNYSPYTEDERTFLENYIEWSNSAITAADLGSLAKGAPKAITPTTQKLAGAYVRLVYSTEINLWGKFVYTDGNKTAEEDFYLQAGTTEHKQYLDIFRENGVGFGMNTNNLSMTSITFTNAELEDKSGLVKVIALYSEAKTIDMNNQEIYLKVDQADGSNITVGAHLGIGGALTYLAKSGVYEGVIGGSSGWKNGTVAITTGDPDTVFGTAKNKYKSGSSSSSYSEEAPYYGSANDSMPGANAVNLINNFDAGRQIQQSWYAQVGGSDSATDGSNGYDRAYCYTGSTEGQYWPYNPVQAGDVVSNPGQIVDYEVNEDRGYIYVKARAMDWAKGYDASRPCENAVEGGVTTKSYVENYYRLNADGTLVVNNGFIDWNGFTNMEGCDWASTELPAVYPVHTLNYYVSNIDGDGTWDDAIEYNNTLKPWTGGTAYHQFANPANGLTKVEDWFAWANGGDANAFGMGIYIPNVDRFTSGRSNTSTAYYTDVNFQNSNALPVDNYSEFSWSSFKNVDMVTDFAERGNILADKGMMSNMQSIQYTYQSAYVSNTSYTAPGVDFRMEAYVPIEYSYVICLGTVGNIRSTFRDIKDNGTVTNAGDGYQKVGLDAWARADKSWTW